MKLSPTQNSTLLSTLGNNGLEDDLVELRRISAKLFESPFLTPTDSILKTENVLKVDEMDWSGHDTDVGDAEEAYGEPDPVESVVSAEGEAFVVKKVAFAKKENQ